MAPCPASPPVRPGFRVGAAGCLAVLLLGTPLHAKVVHVQPRAAAGGDGSLAKPVNSLDQALSLAAPGDTLRLAAGSYPQRRPDAPWRLDLAEVRLEGGWDAAFTSRDPWATPSVLEAAPGFTQPLLVITPNATGLVLDGLTLDGAPGNAYARGGALLTADKRWTPLLRVQRGRAVAVRNCTFLNSPGHGVSASVATTLELRNNLLVNHRVSAVTAWGVLQDAELALVGNTILGTWAESPGGSRGDGVDIQQFLKAQLRGNLITGAQGHCVRLGLGTGTPTLTGNVLGACLRGHVRGWADAHTPAVASVQELGVTSWVEALGNAPLGDVLVPVGKGAVLPETLVSPPPAPDPALTKDSWVPHAPRQAGLAPSLVGSVPGAGVQATAVP